MTDHALFEQYEALNVSYPGCRPTLGANVKYVQCDGCDRIITFAVFHSEYAGGVDVCNICRVVATRSAASAVVCVDRRRRLCFARHPLCFVGPAPLSPRQKVDLDEVEAERRPEVLARRFAKSVNVVPPATATTIAKEKEKKKAKAARGRVVRAGRQRDTCTRANSAEHEVPRSTEGDTEEEAEWEVEVLRLKRPREHDSAVAESRSNPVTPAAVLVAEAPVLMGVPETGEEVSQTPVVAITPRRGRPRTTPPVMQPPVLAAAALELEIRENGVKNRDIPVSSVTIGDVQAHQLKWERIASGAVARFFHHIQPGTKCTAARPSSVACESLCIFNPNDITELTISPNTCCRTLQGFVGLTSCTNVVCVRIVPTLRGIGLWFSVLCEEDYVTRLDIWQVAVSSGSKNAVASPTEVSSVSPLSPVYRGDHLPKRMYSVHVGKHTVVSMDWLPIPLHHTKNNTLGFCTFIRGRYLVSSVLPRSVAVAADTADSVWSGCPIVATEVCGATLVKRDIEFAELRWSSNGTSIAETFLFAVGRCTSVVVLQPTGDTRSGIVTLQVMHYIEARGVASFPSFLKAPPIAVGSTRSGRTMLVVAHGASVACYQGPEFSTKLLVAMDDVVCSLQLSHRVVTAGLAKGALVSINDREPIGMLPSPPLLINRMQATNSTANFDTTTTTTTTTTSTPSTTTSSIPENEGDSFFVADALGDCTMLYKQHDGTMRTEYIFSLSRVRRGQGQRSALLLDSGTIGAPSKFATTSIAGFTQHPLPFAMGARGPLLAFYPDGAWLLVL